MKGIVLAGGMGTRLYPLTKITSKHLLPVYDKQMIFYPIETLKNAGIKDILVISDPKNIHLYKELLGTGADEGLHFEYKVQDRPKGLPEAFILGEDFIGGDNVALILGDNIFEDNFSQAVQTFKGGGRIFAKEVTDPERFGVVEFDKDSRVVSIEEKPSIPRSNFAIPGLYIFDARVVAYAKELTPSKRGELEIVDIQNKYLTKGELDVHKVEGAWIDAGTFDSLYKASKMIKEKKGEIDKSRSNVVVLTVTYGSRWLFLSKVVEEVMKDPHVHEFVIVDNGSSIQDKLKECVLKYGSRITILRNEKNTGSAGGFAHGLEYVRTTDNDFVLVLDDDNVPERDAIGQFLEIKKRIPEQKVVLVGNRTSIPGNEDFFYQPPLINAEPKGTFFETISFKKIKNFIYLLHNKQEARKNPFIMIAPNESFVYGGAFIPLDAVRKAPLPDRDLILYGDDIEYSWGIKRLGYSSYVCYSPKIYDVDLSFGEGSQAVGLFDPRTQPFKIYHRVRNMVLISRRNTKQTKVALFLNIMIWVKALSLLGVLKYGLQASSFRALFLIYKAVYAGYVPTTEVPEEAKLP